MKKLAILISLFLIISYPSAQEIIVNPEKPLSNNVGRILELKEEIRISDENGDFFFTYPLHVIMSQDKSIYITDSLGSNFLKFSPEGEYLKNLYKKGEGPGEIQNNFRFAISQNKILIYDFTKRKIIMTNLDGDLISEYRNDIEFYSEFYGIYGDWLVFTKSIIPPVSERTTAKLYQIKHPIVLLSKDGITAKESYIFHNQFFYASWNGMGWDPFSAVLDENRGYLYVSNIREYLIHVLDLNKGIVIKSFKRKYKRIDYEMSHEDEEFIREINAPKKKYTVDIKNLFLNLNFIWVETSTKDDKKGILIDVFDQKGEYIDNFFLNLKGDLVSVFNSYIFVREADEDENWIIKKYKIVG